MGRLTAAIAAIVVGAGLVAGVAQAQSSSESRDRSSAPPPDPGREITQGATRFGEGIKHGAEQVGDKIKETATDVWEAGKAAVNAGSEKMSGPQKTKASPSTDQH